MTTSSLHKLIKECDFRLEENLLVIDCSTVAATKQLLSQLEILTVYAQHFPVNYLRIDLLGKELSPTLTIAQNHTRQWRI